MPRESKAAQSARLKAERDAERELDRHLAGLIVTPPTELAKLADKYWFGSDVIELVAANPSTPPDTLEALYEKSSSELEAILALNPSLPPHLRVKIARSAHNRSRDMLDAINSLECDGNGRIY